MTKIENTPIPHVAATATVQQLRCMATVAAPFIRRPPPLNDQTCFARVDGFPTDRAS